MWESWFGLKSRFKAFFGWIRILIQNPDAKFCAFRFGFEFAHIVIGYSYCVGFKAAGFFIRIQEKLGWIRICVDSDLKQLGSKLDLDWGSRFFTSLVETCRLHSYGIAIAIIGYFLVRYLCIMSLGCFFSFPPRAWILHDVLFDPFRVCLAWMLPALLVLMACLSKAVAIQSSVGDMKEERDLNLFGKIYHSLFTELLVAIRNPTGHFLQ